MTLFYNKLNLISDIIYVCKTIGHELKTQADHTLPTFKYVVGEKSYDQKCPILFSILDSNKKSQFHLSNQSDRDNLCKWICNTNYNLDYLNSHLLLTSYFVLINSLSIADILIYFRISNQIKQLSPNDYEMYCNLIRWFDLVQNNILIRNNELSPPLINIPKDCHIINSPMLADPILPPPPPTPNYGLQSPASPPIDTNNDTNAAPCTKVDNTTIDIKTNNNEKPPQKSRKPKETAKAEPKPDPNQSKSQFDISALDIRVGLIRDCWKHTGSDKLMCEEVDLGNDEIRQIGSGIREYYEPEQLKNRKVLVLCNLKERGLGGFKSHGMILCASNHEDTQVEILDPHVDSIVGETVKFAGFDGKPVTENVLQKKKLLDLLLPDLKTNSDKLMTFQGVLGMTSFGPISVPTLANSNIS